LAQAAPEAGIDELVVTARRRAETLQTVPLAVTAITAEQIAREGIKDVTNLIDSDPSLNFDQGIAPYDTRIVIRGLSPTRGRPNVASLVDGIDVSSEAIGVAGGSLLINPRLIDIARVEIVKGPQSALYGRSAFAGAINYITQDPEREL
jgi:outer membrane receptor protein involved in Fe transport